MASKMNGVSPYNSSGNGNNGSVNQDYAELFKSSLRRLDDFDFDFDELVDIARKNSFEEENENKGVWLIGGFLYRGIVEELYGPLPEKAPLDVDFLVKMHKQEVYRPWGWEIKRTSHGDLAFTKSDGNCNVDINTLFNLHGIDSRGLPPNIRHFYTANPFNIQSMTYNCDTEELSGKRGIESIKNRLIKTDNLNELEWEAKRLSRLTDSSYTADSLIRKKAKELGFCYELPEKS